MHALDIFWLAKLGFDNTNSLYLSGRRPVLSLSFFPSMWYCFHVLFSFLIRLFLMILPGRWPSVCEQTFPFPPLITAMSLVSFSLSLSLLLSLPSPPPSLSLLGTHAAPLPRHKWLALALDLRPFTLCSQDRDTPITLSMISMRDAVLHTHMVLAADRRHTHERLAGLFSTALGLDKGEGRIRKSK